MNCSPKSLKGFIYGTLYGVFQGYYVGTGSLDYSSYASFSNFGCRPWGCPMGCVPNFGPLLALDSLTAPNDY